MWVKVANIEQLEEGRAIRVKRDNYDLFVVKINGEVYAMQNRCNHYGHGYLLHNGGLKRYVVTCPGHYAQFDVRTGKVISPPEDGWEHIHDQPVYKVNVDGDDVLVELPEKLSS